MTTAPDGRLFHLHNHFALRADFVRRYAGSQPAWGGNGLGYVVYKRTYARPLTPRQREQRTALGIAWTDASTEEFWETIQRVVEGTYSILWAQVRANHTDWDGARAQRGAQEMFIRAWEFKWLPPGRGLFFMGTDALEVKGGAALNNCGFVSTRNIDRDFAEPFCALMDFSMLGVGMGFDTEGAGRVVVTAPTESPTTFYVQDTREGWVEALRVVLESFVGKCFLPVRFDFSRVRGKGAPVSTFGGTASGPEPLETMLRDVTAHLRSRAGSVLTSVDIVDVMNRIGVCVVSGNVRRSSEIALGKPDDAEFVGLKSTDRVNSIRDTRHDYIAEHHLDIHAIDEEIWDLRTQQSHHTVLLDMVRMQEIQKRIEDLTRVREDLAKQDSKIGLFDAIIAADPVNTHRWASNNTVLCGEGQDYGRLAKQTASNGEPGYGWMDTIRAYGRLADPPTYADRDAMGFNPCGEQTLHDGERCCLVETFPTNHETREDWLRTLKFAFLYAKAVTLVPTHRPATNAVMVRNRRIGVSMAGVWSMYEHLGIAECRAWWDAGYKHVRALDRLYSGWMGVKESIKVTSIKPGGTVPLLCGVEGGMKLPTARYYFRTVRLADDSPLVPVLANAGYRVEPALREPHTMVAYFPVRDESDARVASSVSVWEQAALAAELQKWWSDNMVSCTLTFDRMDESHDLARVLAAYEDKLKACSFLPHDTHGYAQAPYIPVDVETWRVAASRVKPLDLNAVGHEADDKYCTGGVCELPAKESA